MPKWPWKVWEFITSKGRSYRLFSSRGDMSNLGVKRFNLMAVSIIECNGQGWEEKAFAIILEKEDSDIVKTR